jgi:Type IV secretion system proteins
MKHLFRVGAVLLSLILAAAPVPASAQLGFLGGGTVFCTNCTDEVTTIAADALEAANWVTQLAHMVTTIENVITVWQMLSGLTSVNQMTVILNSAAYFNAMNSYGNVPQMIQGGGFGSLGGLGGSYLSANTYFMPTVGSPMPMLNQTANIFALRGNSLASIQAISAQSLVTANAILQGLMVLQKLIDLQPSNQFMAGLASRLHSFQGNIASQQWQLQQMQAFAAAQDRVFAEQQRQANYCSAVTWSQHTASLSGVGLTIGGTGPCLSNGITSANPVVAVAATVGSVASLIGGAAGLIGGIGGITDTGTFDAGDQQDLPTPPIPPAGGAGGSGSSLPTPPIPPTDAGDQSGTVEATLSDDPNYNCTNGDGSDCAVASTPADDDGTGNGCSQLAGDSSVGQTSCGLTFTDEAGGTFDPTAPISSVTAPETGTGTIGIQGGDPTIDYTKPGDTTISLNDIPKPASLSGMAVVALLRQRRRRPEQLRDAA